MADRLTPEDLAKSHDGLCGVAIGDGPCSCLVQWVQGLQKDLDAAKLQIGEQARAIRNVQRALKRNENREINMGEAWALINEAVAENKKEIS